MNAMQHNNVLQLNHFGISQLLQHNYEEAIRCFNDALPHLKQSLIRNHRQGNPTKPTPSGPSSNFQYEFADLYFDEGSCFTDRFCNLLGFHDSMICKTAIRIFAERQDSVIMDDEDSVGIALAMIYNLGIATHLWALQEGSVDLLQKALRYYQLAYHMQTHEEEAGSATAVLDDDYYNSVVMCILNNSASIHMLMGDLEKAAEFFRELSSLIVTAGERKIQRNERIWKSFMSNIFTWLMGPPTTAGAA